MTPPPEHPVARRSVLAGLLGAAAGLAGCATGSGDVDAGPIPASMGPTTDPTTPGGTPRPRYSGASSHPEPTGRSTPTAATSGPAAPPTTSATQGGSDPTHRATPDPTHVDPTRPGHDPTGHPTHSPTPSSTPSTTGTPEPPLVLTADVPEGGGVVIRPHSVVVTQPEAGTFRGFDMHCTHMGCPVDSVSDGCIRCPCHGSLFAVADGSVVGGPATRALAARTLDVHDGGVYLG